MKSAPTKPTPGMLCLTALAVIGGLSGCAVNPNTGRNQLMAFPAAQIAHANMGYAISTAAQALTPSSACARARSGNAATETTTTFCPSAASLAQLALQVARLGGELATEAYALAPGLYSRIGAFSIGIENDIGSGTGSSAGGRIAIDSSLAAADPTDDVVAFLIAREMGHVIARHGEEDSGARLAFSLLTTVVPVGGLVVRFVASMLGSQALKNSWADGQRREADEIALALLERTHRSARVIALNLRAGLRRDRLPVNEWSMYFAQSSDRVEAIAFARPKSGGPQLAVLKLRESGNAAIEGGHIPFQHQQSGESP